MKWYHEGLQNLFSRFKSVRPCHNSARFARECGKPKQIRLTALSQILKLCEHDCGLPLVYYFYILRSLKNGKLYLGYTHDLKSRVISHNAGENKATKPNIPYELIYYSAFKNQKDALECEKYFKTSAGWKRIHKMLANSL